MAEILFEKFKVPGLLFGTTGLMSLYAHGRASGVVCEVGEGVSNVVPVVAGVA